MWTTREQISLNRVIEKKFFSNGLNDMYGKLEENVCIYQPLCACRMQYNVNFLKRSLTGFNSEFSFFETGCPIKVKELCLSYYLSIARWKIVGFIPSSRVLAVYDMQIATSSN